MQSISGIPENIRYSVCCQEVVPHPFCCW